MNIKKVANRLANSFGYEVRRVSFDEENILRSNIAQSYSLIYRLGFTPKTVIDVGVAEGTMELYTSFPDSFFLLIEPLKEFEPDLRSILMKYRGSYIIAAAGSKTGEVTFNVHDNHLDGSSLYKEMMGSEADGHEVNVPIIMLDEILKDELLNGPYLIKVDVQGAEIDVLEGGQKALAEAEVVVLEVSMFQFMKGAPEFFDIVFYMKQHGFVAYDIILGWNRPLDNALGQIDIIFVKENGQFRQDHSYSTVEQMKDIFGS